MNDEPRGGASPSPAFRPHELMALYLRGEHDALSQALLALLRPLRDRSLSALDASAQHSINVFVKHFLTLFTQPDYVPAPAAMAEFVRLGETLSNVVALSCFKTTDAFLELLGQGPGDFGKLLTLCSARNRTALDRRSFFEADPRLACIWYGAYAEIYRTGLIDPVVWQNLKDHFAYDGEGFDVRYLPMTSYFAATYVGDRLDRGVRAAINRSWKELAAPLQAQVRNRPAPNKVAILSSSWTPNHSAYRITKAYVEALCERYHVTFVPLGSRQGLDLSLFHEVRALELDRDGAVDIRGLLDNDFSVIYYPDVGLSAHSILLTNLRLAPLQIASLGHSVSTWGAEIDYFFSGVLAEPTDHPERNYSERLVLLPGMGAIHERPDYTPAGPRDAGDSVVVNCPWNAQKLNYPLALALKAILDRASRPVRFRLFVSASLSRHNDFLPFVRDLERVLGPQAFEVVRNLPYQDYMAQMEQGAFSIDAFPFGGCNTVVDSLFVRKLMVCREGDAWYNRIGPAMLRMTGLSELIVTSDDHYIATIVRLIDDDRFRTTLQATLDQADLEATLFNRAEAHSFVKAVDELLAGQHAPSELYERSPVCIP